jgi:hypothetical protein
MPVQQSALTFTQELLALLEWNSFEFEHQLTFRRNGALALPIRPRAEKLRRHISSR